MVSLLGSSGKRGGVSRRIHWEGVKKWETFHVYISDKYNTYSQKIIAAHELGHLLLHSKDDFNMFNSDDSSLKKEYEANIFAMEFMPQIQPYQLDYRYFSSCELQKHIQRKLASK